MDLAWIFASLSKFREMSVLCKTYVFSIFWGPDLLEQDGSRQIGPRHIGPRQIGPHFLWQIGPRQIGPWQIGPWQIGPLGGKLGHSKLGPCIICIYWIYSANNWGIYAIWRVSVLPSRAGLGNMQFLKYVHIF